MSALSTRCSFGAFTGSTSGNAALEKEIGATLKRYVTFQTMGTNGASGWPTADAQWCASTNHDLVIAWDVGAGGPSFADIRAGKNDASLNAFFAAAKAFKGTVILRMWWEFNDPNGPTKPQNKKLVSSTADWVSTWQYVYKKAKAAGATNVKFFWCANGSDTGTYKLEQFYPGNGYVDEIGFDTYNDPQYGPWMTPDAKFGPIYNRIAALNATAPICIGETGTADTGGPSGSSKAQWQQQLFTSSSFPRLKAIDFFSVNKEKDWRIDQTPAAVKVCQQYLPSAPADAIGSSGTATPPVVPPVVPPVTPPAPSQKAVAIVATGATPPSGWAPLNATVTGGSQASNAGTVTGLPADIPQAVFAGERWGDQTWTLTQVPTKGATLELLWAEKYAGVTKAGDRVMAVEINGVVVEPTLDVFARAGKDKLLRLAYTIADVATVTVALKGATSGAAFINGLRVLAS
jgi:hypothetical protein